MRRIIKKLFHKLRWEAQARIVKRSGEVRGRVYLADQTRVLVVAPHADDELIGCYSVIEKAAETTDLYYAGLTGSDPSAENQAARLHEIQTLARRLKLDFYYDEPNDTAVLDSLLKNRYDTIFLPTYIDWHPEHRATAICVLEKLRDDFTGKICFYCVTVPIPAKYVNCYSLVPPGKWPVFWDTYRSQRHLPVDRFAALENSYSTTEGKPIEPYFEIDHEDIANTIDQLERLDSSCLNDMAGLINRIDRIAEASLRLYDEAFQALPIRKAGYQQNEFKK